MLRIFAFTQTLPFQNRQCRKLAYKINKKIADYGKKRLYLFSIKHFLHTTLPPVTTQTADNAKPTLQF